jgi:hypothetical protein
MKVILNYLSLPSKNALISKILLTTCFAGAVLDICPGKRFSKIFSSEKTSRNNPTSNGGCPLHHNQNYKPEGTMAGCSTPSSTEEPSCPRPSYSGTRPLHCSSFFPWSPTGDRVQSYETLFVPGLGPLYQQNFGNVDEPLRYLVNLNLPFSSMQAWVRLKFTSILNWPELLN